MAALSLNRIAWTYTTEGGTAFRVAAQKALTDQSKLGGTAWGGTAPPKPSNIKMRRITVRNAAQGVSRVVPVYDNDAAILTAGETVNLNHLGDSYAFVSDGGEHVISESRPRSSVTKQST
jgi:hypothetical protein